MRSWKTQKSERNMTARLKSLVSLLTDKRLQVKSGTQRKLFRVIFLERETFPVWVTGNSEPSRICTGLQGVLLAIECNKAADGVIWSDAPLSTIQEGDLEACLPARIARLGVESPYKRWSSWPYCSLVRPAMGDWSIVGSLIEVAAEENSLVDRVFISL